MRYVLFSCNHNAARSQMAQAFFERLAPDELRQTRECLGEGHCDAVAGT